MGMVAANRVFKILDTSEFIKNHGTKKNNLIENFANYNIPMLILDEWTDLQSFDVQHLNEVYDKQIQLLYDSDILLFDFWKKLILEV